MISDLDINHYARALVDHHRENAAIVATSRADARLEAGDPDGYAVWMEILRAIEELYRTKPWPGEAVH